MDDMTEVNGLEKPRYKNWIPAKLVASVLLGALALLLCARLLVERAAIAGFILILLSFAPYFWAQKRRRRSIFPAADGVAARVAPLVCSLGTAYPLCRKENRPPFCAQGSRVMEVTS